MMFVVFVGLNKTTCFIQDAIKQEDTRKSEKSRMHENRVIVETKDLSDYRLSLQKS